MSDIIKFSMLSSESEFNSLREPWNGLLSQSDLASVAQTWEWQRNWWDIYGKDRKLNIIVGRENDKIVGIAPFSTTKRKRKRAGFIPYKTIYYLSTGVVSGRNVVSEYLDFIVCMERRREFVLGVLKWLVQYMEWDEILIESVSAESDLPALMKEGSAFLNLRFEITKDLPSVLIKLPQSWSVYLETADSTLRYKINRGRREFEKVKGKYERIDDEGGLADAFLELERLHQHRWESRGGAGAFSDPKWREFHRRFILFAHRNGWLRLSFLLLDGKAVSANYNFAFHGKIHFFQSGIIPHENKHLRLGLILHSYCIEEAIKEHFMEYDFLRMGGKGGGYKNDWGNYSRPLFDMRISRRTLKERVYQMARKSASYLRGGYRDNGNKRDRANSNPATAVEVKSVLNEAH